MKGAKRDTKVTIEDKATKLYILSPEYAKNREISPTINTDDLVSVKRPDSDIFLNTFPKMFLLIKADGESIAAVAVLIMADSKPAKNRYFVTEDVLE